MKSKHCTYRQPCTPYADAWQEPDPWTRRQHTKQARSNDKTETFVVITYYDRTGARQLPRSETERCTMSAVSTPGVQALVGLHMLC